MKKLLNVFKKVLKMLSIILIALVVYVVLVLAIAYIPVNSNEEVCKEECVEVFLYSNGVHTDIVMPLVHELKDWNTVVDSKKTKSGKSNFKYISIGWGDKGFYLNTPTWGDLTFKTAFEAMFYMSESAMHVTFYNDMVENDRCKKIVVSKERYAKIIQYIDSSFEKDLQGNYQYVENASYGNNDVFLEAEGKYSLFYTCNTWTNNCLKAGKLKACLWTVLDNGFFYHYR